MKKIIPLFIALAYFGIATGQTGPQWNRKISASLLEKTSAGQSVPFIIILSEQADVSDAKQLDTKIEKATYVFSTLRDHAVQSQKELIAFLKNKNITYQSLWIVNAVMAVGNLDLIQTIAQRDDVRRIIANPIVHMAEPVDWPGGSDGERGTITWGIDTIHADDVWALGYNGQGAVVGGGDTGYDWSHPALKKQYRGYKEALDTVDHNFNWHDAIHAISPLSADSINPCGINLQAPCDDFGHGTHTMGTMIGLDGDMEIGVAPGAKWCACRNMERGNGAPYTYIECFQWFMAPTDLNNENPDPALAPDVINNSWGCPKSEGCDSSNWELMNMAVNNLRLSGVVVVVSAGNSGSSCSSVQDPAAIFEGSFSVGATAENDTIAGFSSRGPVTIDGSNRPKPDISAPGVRTLSSIPGGSYTKFSGTSMAGPHVVGTVALMISANPALAGQVDLIENIIEQTAVPKTTNQDCGDILGSQVPNNTYGYGRIDALAAVNAALALISTSTDHQESNQGIKVFPNPVDNVMIFDIQHALGKVNAEIFDVQGQMIIHQQWNAEGRAIFQVDFSAIPPGIYFYRVMMKGGMQIGKVVKK